MQEVAEAFVQHDTDSLEAHGRFLAETRDWRRQGENWLRR